MKSMYTVKLKLRFLGLGLFVLVSILLSTVLGVGMTFRHGVTNAPGAPATAVVERPAPPHDPRKPTVAILLGDTSSELTDVLGPYALLAESGAYNVYTVASSRTIRRLTGGLEVMPQLSYGELAVRLHGTPDIIVLPAVVDIGSAVNLPVLAWLREQAQAHPLLFSWCTGAEVLAASGLIDGQAATAHWGDISRLERAYPRVHWQRGVRYIDSGMLLTTGGLTCGIDATLHLIKRRNGEASARKAALAVRYPLSKFIDAPQMPQYQFELTDSILLFNAAYSWPKRRAAIWLYDGVGELDLAAIFDVYPASGTVEAYTVAEGASVVSRHGLQFVPRWNVHTLPTMDRVLVPGGDAVTAAARRLPDGLGGADALVKVLGTPNTRGFSFKVTLEDLAWEQDRPTAVFAAKRLEYRDAALQLAGQKWPLHLLVLPLVVGTSALGCVCVVNRWIRQRRHLDYLKVPPVVDVLFLGALMWLISLAFPAFALVWPAHGYFAVGLMIAGALISILGIMAFKRAGTTVNPLEPERATSLVVSGIYSRTRNPMYLGFLLVLGGWAIFVSNALAFLLVPAFTSTMNRFQIPGEEQTLTSLFGHEYIEYQSRVRRWL